MQRALDQHNTATNYRCIKASACSMHVSHSVEWAVAMSGILIALLTLNELCTKVSSKSITMHFLTGSPGFNGLSKYSE